MNFEPNHQIGGARDAAVFEAQNLPDHQAVWEAAKSEYLSALKMQEEQPRVWDVNLEWEWTTWEARRHPTVQKTGINADDLLTLSKECRQHFVSRKADLAVRIAERVRTLVDGQETSRREVNSISSRTAWANAHLRPLWNLKYNLDKLSKTIESTRPTAMVMQMPFTATAPIGTDTELSAALDAAEADLAKVGAALKTIRAESQARTKLAA